MKTRRHHNNKGTRQTQRGKVTSYLERLAYKLNVAFKNKGHRKQGD